MGRGTTVATNRFAILICALISASSLAVVGGRPAAPIFRFDAANVWLNLHQFLYVLGRDAAEQPDRARRAVVQAPKDQTDALASMAPGERTRWTAAVAAYATGPSSLDAVFDKVLVDAATALAATKPDAASLAGVAIPPDMRAALESAAPIYRAKFWPAHHAANDRWVSTLQPLLGQHGARILDFITSKYGLPWPPDGYPVRVVAYANWAGAFSTGDRLLMISSQDEGNRGSSALETIFHEAMHQWDDSIAQTIDASAKAQGKTAPENLSHAMIFYTAGEAVRRVIPGHVPYAEANGLWRRMGGLKPALDRFWLPYLNGAGTRNDAIASVIGG